MIKCLSYSKISNSVPQAKGKKRVMFTGCKFRIQNCSQLCLWLKATENLEPEQVKQQVYRCDRVFWLTLLLADPQERLDYSKVWKAGALQLMLGVWNCSRILPRKSAMAVQKRVDRFFNISGIMRTHSFTVRVASLSDNAVFQTKKKVARIINSTRRCNSWLADYLQEKIKVCKVKSWSLARSFESHIKTAKETNVYEFLKRNIDNDKGLKSWSKREDCFCSSIHWDVPMETRNVELVGNITKQLRALIWHFRVDQIGSRFVDQFEGETLVYVSDEQKEMVRLAKAIGKFAVVADKDSKRRIFMTCEGYQARLIQGYLGGMTIINCWAMFRKVCVPNGNRFWWNVIFPKDCTGIANLPLAISPMRITIIKKNA